MEAFLRWKDVLREKHYLICWEGDIPIIILKAVIPHQMSVDRPLFRSIRLINHDVVGALEGGQGLL